MHCREHHKNTWTKYEASSSTIKFTNCLLFLYFPSCRCEVVLEFKKCSWKIRLWKMMKSYFMVKQKSAPTSAEIDRIAVFPDLRVMLHSTPAASGKIWSLSTSIASRTPQKTKYQARSSYETIQFSMIINSFLDGSRWDCPLFPSFPNFRYDMFVINITVSIWLQYWRSTRCNLTFVE